MKLFKKDAATAVRELVAKVESAIAKTQLKLAATEAEVERHRADRREHLRTNPGEDVPASTRHGLDVAEGQVTACKEILAEHEAHLAELREALAAAEDSQVREAAAKADEDLAGFVDNRVATELEKGSATIAGAVRAFLETAPEDFDLVEARTWSRPADHPRRHASHYSPRELIIALVADALAHAAPELFAVEGATGGGYASSLPRMFDIDHDVPMLKSDVMPPPARHDAAKMLISDRLRARAAAARSGPATKPAEGLEAAE